jgi:hypothetical protein
VIGVGLAALLNEDEDIPEHQTLYTLLLSTMSINTLLPTHNYTHCTRYLVSSMQPYLIQLSTEYSHVSNKRPRHLPDTGKEAGRPEK